MIVKGVVIKGSKLNGLYASNGQIAIGEAIITNNKDMSKLWYLKLGDISERGFRRALKAGSVWER